MNTKLTQAQVNKRYRDKYVEVYQEYDYKNQRWMYEVRKVYKNIHENTTLGQDVGTSLAYCRQETKMNTWYAKKAGNYYQGLVIDEVTGENIAVTYKEENAALVAAAPALLNALERLVEAHDEIPSMLTAEEWRNARQAIYDAKGD